MGEGGGGGAGSVKCKTRKRKKKRLGKCGKGSKERDTYKRGALSWVFLKLKVMRCSHRHPSDPCRTQTVSPRDCACFLLYCHPRRPPEHLTSAAPQSRAPSLISLLIEHIFAAVCQPIKAAILFVDSCLSGFTDFSLNRLLSLFNRDLFTSPFPDQHRPALLLAAGYSPG